MLCAFAFYERKPKLSHSGIRLSGGLERGGVQGRRGEGKLISPREMGFTSPFLPASLMRLTESLPGADRRRR